MAVNYDEIVAKALNLPLGERVKLAQELSNSLDDSMADEVEIEKLWIQVAE